MERNNRTVIIGRIVITINTTLNDTDDAIFSPNRNIFYVSVDIIALIGVLATNGFVLGILLCNRHLHTPFNIYVMSLCTSNILCYDVFVNVLQILNDWYATWWMGPAACVVLLYGNFVFTGGTNMSHFLITFNRLWAVFHPFSYREYHSRNFAVIVCLSIWAIIHLVTLPPLLLDLPSKGRVDEGGCDLDPGTHRTWTLVVLIVVYLIPTAFVIGSYPVFVYKKIRTGVEKGRDVVPSVSSRNQSLFRSRHRELDRGFLVLTAMTMSVTVCWLPNNVSATVTIFTGRAAPEWMRKMFWALYPVQALIDPVLFAVCLQDVRQAVRKCLSIPCRAGTCVTNQRDLVHKKFTGQT
ncbi:5-hydroxytryptamine receptor 1D-like [Paramacrobiotus metropolitanus]|uniref:5-hydroxytryptamine receptor 1D-like n=1 Tax=Paramacrobiotus metropolitanus TaxID=2943436 RepID=UPI0024456424|nr:5-hydroxytryptamine receptor 1D-like [Paramacrobiotus metropolitanus]